MRDNLTVARCRALAFLAGMVLILSSIPVQAQNPVLPYQQDQIAAKQFVLVPQVPVQQVNGVTVSPSQPGASTYYYWVVTILGGHYSYPAGPFQVTGAPTTLSATAFNTVSWPPITGATYDLLRTATGTQPTGACACAVVIGTSATTQKDIANALGAYTVTVPASPYGYPNTGDIAGWGVGLDGQVGTLIDMHTLPPGLISVGLTMPGEFSVTGSPVTGTGTFGVTWTNENEATVFAGPVTPMGGVDQTVTATTTGNTGNPDPLIMGPTPSQYPEFAVLSIANWAGGAPAPDGSWTGINGTNNRLSYKSVASGTASASIDTGHNPLNAIMTLFARGSSPPAIIQKSTGGSGTWPGTFTATFTNSVAAGDTIVVVVWANGSTGSPATSFAVTDNQGNPYAIYATMDRNAGSRMAELMAGSIGVAAGSTTVTVTVTGGSSMGNNEIDAVEISNLSTLVKTAPPSFRALVDSDLPVVDVPHGGTGLQSLPAYNVLIGNGTLQPTFAPPVSAGYILTDNGPGVSPTFQHNPANFTQAETISICASGCDVTATLCTTSSSSYDVCFNSITWPIAFADANYRVVCTGELSSDHAATGGGSTNYALAIEVETATKAAASFTIITQTMRGAAGAWDQVDCTGTHP